MAKKSELLALLKGESVETKKKAFTVRFDPELFEKIELISSKSKPKTPINTVILALIELGLAEYEKSL